MEDAKNYETPLDLIELYQYSLKIMFNHSFLHNQFQPNSEDFIAFHRKLFQKWFLEFPHNVCAIFLTVSSGPVLVHCQWHWPPFRSRIAPFEKKKGNPRKNLKPVKNKVFFEKKGKCKVWNAGPLKNYIKTI